MADRSLDDIIAEQSSARGRRGPKGGSGGGGRKVTQGPRSAGKATPSPRRRVPANVDAGPVDTGTIKVSSESDVHKVAGMIAQTTRTTGAPPPCVGAIGYLAVNQAIKSLAIARQFLNDDDCDLIAQPRFEENTTGAPSGRSLITLKKINKKHGMNEAAELLVVRDESNPWKVAGAIAMRTRENKSIALVTVGPSGVFAATRAIAAAQGYLEQDNIDLKFCPFFQLMDWSGREEVSGIRFELLPRSM